MQHVFFKAYRFEAQCIQSNFQRDKISQQAIIHFSLDDPAM